MKKLYEKNELTFTIFCILQAVVIFGFMKKNSLFEWYGLCKTSVPARRFLYYIPLLILCTRNFWNGTAVNLNPMGMVCCIACMLCVGFLEEVIFRGFLFKAIAKDNVKMAIIISSVTFGMGHLINLVNGSGAGIADNLYQVTGAIAIGFLFVVLSYRGGSLLPCITAHVVINITSVFANEVGLTDNSDQRVRNTGRS